MTKETDVRSGRDEITEEEDAQRLRPIETAASLAEMKSLSREIAEAWASDKSAVELVSEQRR